VNGSLGIKAQTGRQAGNMKLIAIIAQLVLLTSTSTFNNLTSLNEELFTRAWEVQNKLAPNLEQVDSEVRVSISLTLKSSSSVTLEKLEENSKVILELEKPLRATVAELTKSLCSLHLLEFLNTITTFTGFASSNCVTKYNENVGDDATKGQQLIGLFKAAHGEMQQIVVTSFANRNAFIQSLDIIDQFKTEFDDKFSRWNELRLQVDAFLLWFEQAMSIYIAEVDECFKSVQRNVLNYYAMIPSRVESCIEFDENEK